MTEPKVNIVLATYNGEKFIEQQLDSIIAQTYENIDIYIRDDGSSDHTVDIVEQYIAKNKSSKKIILLNNHGENLRCPKSFYEIIRRCEPADYYSLCDQDDIWYPEKIQRAVKRLQQEDNDQVLLYYSACDYSTAEGELIRKSPLQKENMELKDVLYYTPGSGFTIVFNEAARKKLVLDVIPGEELHDRWLMRGTVCFGKMLYDSKSTASHIRHDNAVTAGDAGNGNLIMNFFKAELCGDDSKNEKLALKYFLDTFQKDLSYDDVQLLTIFSKKNSVKGWFQKVFYPRRLRTRLPGEIALRILFFIGKI